MKRRKTLPPVSPKTPSEIRPLISAMTEIIETGEGVRGNPLDRKITMRDLLDSGIGKLKSGMRANMGGSLESGFSPPAPDMAKPPAPEGFSAEGSFYGMINLTWNNPLELYANHAYTNIYRGESDNFANAQIAGRDPGMIYSDVVRDDAADPQDTASIKGYYYWITFTSTSGVEGPPNSADGIYAEPLADMEYVLSILSGQLSESELAGRLNDRIDLIDGPADLTGSVAQRIREEALARIQTIEAEAEARIDALQSEESARKVAIQSEATARESEDAVLGRRLDSLTAAKDEVAADLAEEREARVSGDSALSRSIDAYYARTTQDTQAAIAQERQARTQADSAITEDVTTLRSRVAGNESAISNEQQTRADADSAMASAVNSLTARLDATPMWVSSFEPGADFDRWMTQGGGGLQGDASSYAGDQAALLTHSGGQPPSSGKPGTVYAKVPESLALNFAGRRIRVTGYARQAPTDGATQFAVAYSTADVGNSGWERFSVNNTWSLFEFLWDVPEASSGGADYIGIWADTSGSGKGVLIDLINIQPAASEEDLPAITAAIQEEQKARADADGALAEKINTAQAQLGDDIALAQTRLTTEAERIDGELVAMGAAYTAQVQANGLIGGFGVYNDGSRVDAAFDVDRFWIGRSDGDKAKPFMVVGGKTYIDTAMIREGSIQEGQIGPITVGKLFKPDGTPVTTAAGLFRADAIDVDNLRVAEAAQFYGDVYSGTYRSGRRGWAILQNGDVEFNEGTFNGKVEFKNVQGAGTLAGRDHVWWSEVSGGGKPADNADRTSDNTAKGIKNQGVFATRNEAWWSEIKGYNRPDDRADRTGENTSADTNKVNGRSAHTVKNEARRGNQSAYKTDNWTRPGSSLINGNKIYTGDAYVDTLQIKGQAVTIPASTFASGSISLSSSWRTIASVTINPQGSPLFMDVTFACTALGRDNAGRDNTAHARVNVHLRFVTSQGSRDLGSVASSTNSSLGSANTSLSTALSCGWTLSGRNGNISVSVQVRLTGTEVRGSASSRSLFVLGMQR